MEKQPTVVISYTDGSFTVVGKVNIVYFACSFFFYCALLPPPALVCFPGKISSQMSPLCLKCYFYCSQDNGAMVQC